MCGRACVCVSLASRRGEAGPGGGRWGKGSHVSIPLPRGGGVYRLSSAQLWTPRPRFTCLLAVASPGLNLGPPSLISRDLRDPWQGFCFPAPCHPPTPLHCTPMALPALDSVPESRGWTRRGWCGFTFSVPQCLARRRCYISVCSRYYFLLGGSWHLAASLQHSESVANACQGSGVQ